MPKEPRTKTVAESAIDYYPFIIAPPHLNARGTVDGGAVMQVADHIAAIVAQRHSGRGCVTLLVDSVRFLAPARQGEVLVFKAALNRVWNSSMEVGVKVFAENYLTGECRHVVSAYLTFVALDEHDRPTSVDAVLPQSTEELRRFTEAERRRTRRLANENRQNPTSH